MAAKTQLSPMGTPGRRYSFSAKAAAYTYTLDCDSGTFTMTGTDAGLQYIGPRARRQGLLMGVYRLLPGKLARLLWSH